MKKFPYSLKGLLAVAMASALTTSVNAGDLKGEVIHWWTSEGEAAAIREIAQDFDSAGGQWVDNAIAGASNARNATINRILGGDPPAAAVFNTSKQYHEIIAEGLLNNIDSVAQANNWDGLLPQPIINSIKVDGHYYAAPVNIHMPAWFWYSKEAFAKAGISEEPTSFDELFEYFDKLEAAGIVPLALGGQSWQEWIAFYAVLSNVGGAELYRGVFTDSSGKTAMSDEFKHVLHTFKRLKAYVDAGSPGRNWNDATAMLVKGEAGVQIMGDWAKGEFFVAGQEAGTDFGCIAGFNNAPYLIAGDVFVFPHTDDDTQKEAQLLLAETMLSRPTQVKFNMIKGSIPVRSDVDASAMDACAKTGIDIMKDKSRHMETPYQLVSPDVEGALMDVITEFWNSDMSVDDAAEQFAQAIQG